MVGDSAGKALRGRPNDLRGAESLPLQRRTFMAGVQGSVKAGQKRSRLCGRRSNAAWWQHLWTP